MLDTFSDLQSTLSLGHFPRKVRVSLMQALCQTIRADLMEHGADPKLMLLGMALDYTASMLADAGEDPDADMTDAALAQLDEELRLFTATLRAALHRPQLLSDPVLAGSAADILAVLAPCGESWDSFAAARGVTRLAAFLDTSQALDSLGCRPILQHVEEALDRAQESVRRCQLGGCGELQQRARSATPFAEGVLRRLLGYVTALTEPEDEGQRQRALLLLRPLHELLRGREALREGWPAPSASRGHWGDQAYR